MSSANFINLQNAVINSSEAAIWKNAVLEWDIADCEEDEELASSCICGKEELRYLFTIQNKMNGNILYPIGSSCIKKFSRSDLNEYASVNEQLFRLLHAIEKNNFILLSSDYFSRKLLAYLYFNGAFRPTVYNNYNSEKDYEFLLKMFNKRDKDSITRAQTGKISAIFLNSIKPFLQSKLKDKIRQRISE